MSIGNMIPEDNAVIMERGNGLNAIKQLFKRR